MRQDAEETSVVSGAMQGLEDTSVSMASSYRDFYMQLPYQYDERATATGKAVRKGQKSNLMNNYANPVVDSDGYAAGGPGTPRMYETRNPPVIQGGNYDQNKVAQDDNDDQSSAHSCSNSSRSGSNYDSGDNEETRSMSTSNLSVQSTTPVGFNSSSFVGQTPASASLLRKPRSHGALDTLDDIYMDSENQLEGQASGRSLTSSSFFNKDDGLALTQSNSTSDRSSSVDGAVSPPQVLSASFSAEDDEVDNSQADDPCNSIQVAVRLRPLMAKELSPDSGKKSMARAISRRSSLLRRGRTNNHSGIDDVRAWSIVRDSNDESSSLIEQGISKHTANRSVFSFDKVFGEFETTAEVYEKVAKPIVRAVSTGRNGTIFAYGQTGAGKTFTMQGDEANQNSGIIQMAAKDLFDNAEAAAGYRDYSVRAQYFEIYNEQIRDLLSVRPEDHESDGAAAEDIDDSKSNKSNKSNKSGKSNKSRLSLRSSKSNKTNKTGGGSTRGLPFLRSNSSVASAFRSNRQRQSSGSSVVSNDNVSTCTVREDAGGHVVVNAKEYKVHCVSDVLDLLIRGLKNRTCAATDMNERSSRSHAIFRLTIESRDKEPDLDGDRVMRISTLNLVDLAGSENSHSAGVAGGVRMREEAKINQSLLSLSKVIRSLSLPSHKRPKHIGYRDSKLTRILQPSLSGNAAMAILCCVSTARMCLEETRSTLKFAASAKLIKVKPTVNEVVDSRAIVDTLQRELQETRELVKMLEQQVAASGSVIGGSQSFAGHNLFEKRTSATSRAILPHGGGNSHREVKSTSGASEGRNMNPPVPEVVVMNNDTFLFGASSGPTPSVSQRMMDDPSSAASANDQTTRYIQEKINATDELVEKLLLDLENARRYNQDLNLRNVQIETRLANLEQNKDGKRDDDELLMQQHVLLKYGIYIGLALFLWGQTEYFLATVMFLWLSLEVST